MAKFVEKTIDAVRGKQRFRQLIIVPDKVDATKMQSEIDRKEREGLDINIRGVLDEYEDSLEAKYKSSFTSILAIMNRVAELQTVSPNQFKDVTPKNGLIKEYEFKSQDLRVLAIKIANGQLILLGGYKNQQKKDFSKFRSLKEQYLKFINEKNEKI